MAMANHNSRILIVGGGGVIGSSTALELARRGYKDIRLLDVFENPSANSAGNDKNKDQLKEQIAGDDSAGIWGEVGQESWKMWMNDPVFKPYAHQVGRLDLTSKPEREARLRARYEGIVAEGRGDNVEWLDTEDAIIAKAPHLANADLTGWRGLFVKPAGWVAAREALNGVGHELRRLAVKTAFGTSGTFHSLILEHDKTGKVDAAAGGHSWSQHKVKGVRCADGSEWYGDVVIIAAGAWTPALIDLAGQCVSKAWTFAHVQLTPEEAQYLKGMPTMYNHELGFYMEPEPSTAMIKLVNEFEGLTNVQPWRPFPRNIAGPPFAPSDPSPFPSEPIPISVPRSHALNPTDTIPTECLAAIERLVDHCLPFLNDPETLRRTGHTAEGRRELVQRAMCWCTDTVDSNWLICRDPRWSHANDSAPVILATGDSGQTFKMFPVVGKQVADLIEGKLAPERKHLWRWRPDLGDENGTGRAGAPPKDLKEVEGWNHDPVRSRL